VEVINLDDSDDSEFILSEDENISSGETLMDRFKKRESTTFGT
jgi:hypothetical protein